MIVFVLGRFRIWFRLQHRWAIFDGWLRRSRYSIYLFHLHVSSIDIKLFKQLCILSHRPGIHLGIISRDDFDGQPFSKMRFGQLVEVESSFGQPFKIRYYCLAHFCC